MRKGYPQKNTLLKNAKANAKGNFFKRVFFFSYPRRIFSSPIFFIFFSPTHGLNRKPNMTASNVNRFADRFVQSFNLTHLRTDRRASGNSGFKKLAAQWLLEHSTSHQHLWWLDSFVLRNRQLLKPAKR